VNPGIFLANAGADFDITPKLRALQTSIFSGSNAPRRWSFCSSSPHPPHDGEDFGVGVEYRPPLSENIILTGGASALQPGQGFKDIYTAGHFFRFSVP